MIKILMRIKPYTLIITVIILIMIYIFNCSGYKKLSILNYLWKRRSDKIFYNTNLEWCNELRENYEIIRNEFLKYQQTHLIPTIGQFSKEDLQLSDNQTEKWRSAVLQIYGKETDVSKDFPLSWNIIKKIPGIRTTMFSILEPNKKIPPHYGPNNCVLRYHLALIVPKNKENCTITVGDETKYWEEGKDMIFDDTNLHYVNNNTNEQRVVLFLDIQKKYNIFFDTFNNLFFSLFQYNSTIIEIYNKINNHNIKLN